MHAHYVRAGVFDAAAQSSAFPVHGKKMNLSISQPLTFSEIAGNESPFRVLALDGGGMRGVISLTILKEFERIAGRKVRICLLDMSFFGSRSRCVFRRTKFSICWLAPVQEALQPCV